MWVDGFDYRYVAARRQDGGRDTYAAVLVSKSNDDIYAQLTVAVVGAGLRGQDLLPHGQHVVQGAVAVGVEADAQAVVVGGGAQRLELAEVQAGDAAIVRLAGVRLVERRQPPDHPAVVADLDPAQAQPVVAEAVAEPQM